MMMRELLERLGASETSSASRGESPPFVLRDPGVFGSGYPGILEGLGRRADEIRNLVRCNGVLLLRKLPVETPEQYQAVLEVLGYDLYSSNYGGASPRSQLTAKTFVSTEAPAPFIINLHTEFCYQSRRPGMISFFCLQPASAYGETPLFDCNRVWNSLSLELRNKLETQGLLYRRYFYNKRSLLNFQKTWRDTFYTNDPAAVETYLREEGMEFEWDAKGNLATSLRIPAVIADPQQGLPCLSITMFNADAWIYSLRRFRERYNPLLRFALESLVKREYSKPNAFLEVRLGNGQLLSREETVEVLEAAWNNAVVFHWSPGDLLLIDNIRFAHGRLNVAGPRRLIAGMADRFDVRRHQELHPLSSIAPAA